MVNLIDGKAIAAEIKAELLAEVQQLQSIGIQPKLAVVLVGDDPASVVYAKSKQKVSMALGFAYELHELPGTATDQEVLALLEQLNLDSNVHGIMVELPLPKQLNKAKILRAVSPLKDIDGVHPINRGFILSGEPGLFPATPQSCIEIMKRSGITIAGKHAVIVGRGETVGKPLVFLILKEDATVTVCHSKTPDLAQFTRQADILIVAVGKAKMITAEMIKPGAIVVDAGINEAEEGICGDVDFHRAQEVAGRITPVPGGVGALTTVLILKNVLKALRLQQIGQEGC